jgi:HK97 family phage prohead protease
MPINYKLNTSLKLKDLDEKNGVVKVAISTAGFKDSDGDVIIKAAFAKTLKERGPEGINRIVQLMHHNTNKVVGRPKEFGFDGDMLYAVSTISNSTMGKDLIEDYKLDLYEHSIGFETIKEQYSEEAKANIITELKLWEYSSVTWGANEKTPFLGFVKGLTKDEQISKASERMSLLLKAVRNGNYTDERFEMLEYELKQIEDLYLSLIKPEPLTHLDDNKPTAKELIDIINNSLKFN